MPRVDAIAHGLADEVRAERPAPEPVPLEELPLLAAVGVVRQRAVDLEVVAPAREFEPVEPPAGAGGREIGDRHVRPLAREQRDRSGHCLVSLIGGCRLRVDPGLSRPLGPQRGRRSIAPFVLVDGAPRAPITVAPEPATSLASDTESSAARAYGNVA